MKQKKSGRFRVDTRRTIMSKEDGQNLETPINVNNKNYFKLMPSLM